MSEHKSFVTHLGEAIDRYRAQADPPAPARGILPRRRWLPWLGRQMVPNIGTLLLVAVLLLTVPSLAAPRLVPDAGSTSTISYQGRLSDTAGNPITDYKSMVFRIYEVPDGGVPLWEEFWTGGNSVQVSDGLFNVMLGSINPNLAAAITGENELYLGIEVGNDGEMMPRVQLGSVPFSMRASTLVGGAVVDGDLSALGNVGVGKTDPLWRLDVNGEIQSTTNVLLKYATVTTDGSGQADMVAYVAVLKPAQYWMECQGGGAWWMADYDFDYNASVGRLFNLPPNCKVAVYYVNTPSLQGNPVHSPPDW